MLICQACLSRLTTNVLVGVCGFILTASGFIMGVKDERGLSRSFLLSPHGGEVYASRLVVGRYSNGIGNGGV